MRNWTFGAKALSIRPPATITPLKIVTGRAPKLSTQALQTGPNGEELLKKAGVRSEQGWKDGWKWCNRYPAFQFLIFCLKKQRFEKIKPYISKRCCVCHITSGSNWQPARVVVTSLTRPLRCEVLHTSF